jgi:large subunit ribosomal protein L10
LGKESDWVDRRDKERLVEQLKVKFARNDVAVLTRFTGLKVPELNRLRDELKELSVDYHVVKNTLVRRALEGTDGTAMRDHIHGPIAIAFARGDIVPVAKLLTKYTKDYPSLKMHAGLALGRLLDAGEIEHAATLPDRDVLVAKVLFLMNAPLIHLMRVLRAVPEKLVRTLAAIQEEKEKTA